MESRDSITTLGSNALVSVVSYYTRLLEMARREAEGYLLATQSEHRRAEALRLELAEVQLNYAVRRRADHDATKQQLDPILQAVDDLFKGLRLDADNRSQLFPEVVPLYRLWLARRADGELVAEAAPAHPDPVRGTAPGPDERDA